MQGTGVEALATVLTGLRRADERGAPAEQVAAELWPVFRVAVAHALTEMREDELEGLARWREGRHTTE